MIRIARNQQRNGRDVRPPQSWFTQAAAKTAVALVEKSAHQFDATVYGADDLRAALEELFHNKCAYCESDITSGADWDVEHYRPKGKVSENALHPGYYWLPYEWTNLFPSCPHCNQSRRDRKTFDDPATLPAAGKLDQFPLSDESTRAMKPEDNIAREKRLLLSPSDDQPESHLSFGVDGSAIAVASSAMGIASINVFHLNRRRLKLARRKQAEMAVKLMRQIVALRAKRSTAAAAKLLQTFFDEEIAADNVVHAGVGRAVKRDPAAVGL